MTFQAILLLDLLAEEGLLEKNAKPIFDKFWLLRNHKL
jgi:hypothetical protein